MEYVVALKKTRGMRSFYTRGEEIFNAVSHIAGAAVGAVFWSALAVLFRSDPIGVAAVSAFGLGVVALYTMSALYHFLPDGRAKAVFRIFDHCTIFLLIAGTYSPYCLIPLRGTPVGTAVLAAEWVIAAAGITMNAIAMNNRIVKAVSMGLYFASGWLALIFFRPLITAVRPACVLLLLAGGVAYTAGIFFFALGKRVRYFHSVWHLFDLAGTILQFCSILLLA